MKNKITDRMDLHLLVKTARKFSILCHPARTEIMKMLDEHKILNIEEIKEKLHVLPTETLFHLNLLYEAGFISKKNSDKIRCYSINSDAIEKIIEYSDYLYKRV